jgi:hypothetical protein
VSDGVEVNVIDVPPKISGIANSVLPESSLPEPGLSAFAPGLGTVTVRSTELHVPAREIPFDESPPSRVVVIVVR